MNRQEIRYIEIYNAKNHAEERLKELGKTLILKQKKNETIFALSCVNSKSVTSFIFGLIIA